MKSQGNEPNSQNDCSIFEAAASLLAKKDLLQALPAECIPMIKEVERLLLAVGAKAAEPLVPSTNESTTSRQTTHMTDQIRADLNAYKLRIPPSQKTDSFLARLESYLDGRG